LGAVMMVCGGRMRNPAIIMPGPSKKVE
jgi:hypothetical protein